MWFVVSVVAFIARTDHLGVTSFIRELLLREECYECLLNFFRSTAYSLDVLRNRWYEVVHIFSPLYRVNGRAILVGDGVKQSKEAFHMPGVKKMVQESETSSKPEYIHGHMFGALSVLVGNCFKRFSLPLKINIQEGLTVAASWPEKEGIVDISPLNHICQIVTAAFEVSAVLGDSYLLLDRYFLSRPALALINEKNNAGSGNRIEVITKAKSNCIAYRRPYQKEKTGRGRPPKKGTAVKLSKLFGQKRLFTTAVVTMYGKEETVSYHCVNLIWGQGLYQKLRFVLVKYNGMQSILVSSDLNLSPETIIELYSLRFSIEEMFREFKQQLGGFCYHFWTTKLPKLNHFAKKEDSDPLEHVIVPTERIKILNAIKAIEMFVFCSSVAMGLLQLLALDNEIAKAASECRYLRTRSNAVPSEATISYYLRNRIFCILLKSPDSCITKYIQRCQKQDVARSG